MKKKVFFRRKSHFIFQNQPKNILRHALLTIKTLCKFKKISWKIAPGRALIMKSIHTVAVEYYPSCEWLTSDWPITVSDLPVTDPYLWVSYLLLIYTCEWLTYDWPILVSYLLLIYTCDWLTCDWCIPLSDITVIDLPVNLIGYFVFFIFIGR